MTFKDTINGPTWVVWIVFAFFLASTIILLSGHGANLISGYKRMSPEKKARYDERKLVKVVGFGNLLITIMLFISGAFMDFLPYYFAYILGGVIVWEAIVTLVLMNTVCRVK